MEIRTEINLGWCLIKCNRYDDAFKVYSNLIIYLTENEGISPDATYEPAANASHGEQEENGKKSVVELLKELKTKLQGGQPSDSDIINNYNARWDDIDRRHQMQILHNFYNCLFLGRAEKKEQTEGSNIVQGNMNGSNTEPIASIIREICQQYEDKDEWLSFLEQLRILQGKDKQDKDRQGFSSEDWKKLSENFDGIVKKHSKNIMVYSYWVITNVNYYLQLFPSSNDQYNKIRLLSGLISSNTPITMRAYIEIAKIILKENFLEILKNESDRFKNMTEKDKIFIKNLENSFLESFCGVELLENGTNRAFMNLMKNDEICSIKITYRAKLLALILELYGYILQIKNQFRMTYKNLEAYKKKPEDKNEEDPLIYQYTKLSTLKNLLLPKKDFDYIFEEETQGQRNIKEKENSPKLRLSNVARMNDACEGSMFKEIFENVIEEKQDNKQDNKQDKEKLKRIMNTYIDNMFDFRNKSRLSIQDSNVYIACFSMNKNNFGLWSNYADDEKGCVMGFDQSFFDFVDNNDNFMPDDEAEENALYRVAYVDADSFSEKTKSQAGENGNGSREPKEREKEFNKSDREVIGRCIPGIFNTLCKIDDLLKEFDEFWDPDEPGRIEEVVHVFIADRLNEIRFLFKSKSYLYEEELRIIRCSQEPEIDDTDAYPIPRLYVNVEKEIEKLTLVIGSRVEQQQFKELSVWAKNTKRVKQVIWSELNRLK